MNPWPRRAGLALLALALLVAHPALAQEPKPRLVSFPSCALELRGFLWTPAGPEPFPALLWNHGSEKLPGAVDPVGQFMVGAGHAFFVPHRRGHGRSPGPYIMDELRSATSALDRSALLVRLHEAQVEDQLAALAFLQAEPQVDRARIAVMGFSFGGIQAMLAVERAVGFKAAVNCSGAAQTWQNSVDLQSRLKRAARAATMPVFFLQAENDFDLTPNKVLAEEVARAGRPVVARLYPPFGSSAQDGHDFCVKGVATWGPDVLAFLATHLR